MKPKDFNKLTKRDFETMAKRIKELEKGIDTAMMHLQTNYDIDGNPMSESDAYDCLQYLADAINRKMWE